VRKPRAIDGTKETAVLKIPKRKRPDRRMMALRRGLFPQFVKPLLLFLSSFFRFRFLFVLGIWFVTAAVRHRSFSVK